MNPASSGTLVLQSGESRPLQLAEIRIQPLGHWTSPSSGNEGHPLYFDI